MNLKTGIAMQNVKVLNVEAQNRHILYARIHRLSIGSDHTLNICYQLRTAWTFDRLHDQLDPADSDASFHIDFEKPICNALHSRTRLFFCVSEFAGITLRLKSYGS